jgi:hypothetical protein
MQKSYKKNNYLTQTDCALLFGVTTKKKFNGVSTIHKGANEYVDYTTLDKFGKDNQDEVSGRNLLPNNNDNDDIQIQPEVKNTVEDQLVDYEEQ